ncbi:MAG: PH domain-containing protein [Tannerella sp.]|jgi:hypothetical protein|nr:PH domain-containing protein [Tannerella sp.]
MENKKLTFKSRVSGLLVIIFLAAFIPLFIKDFLNQSFPSMYISGGVFLLMIILLAGMRYIIHNGKLYLKMWFIPNGSVDINDIISVNRSYNSLSSNAGSLKRLSIYFKTNRMFWLISHVREKEFVETLKSINPYIDFCIPKETGKWRILDWDIYK